MVLKVQLNEKNMKQIFDAIDELSAQVSKKDVAERALKRAVKPMLDQAKFDAPEGPTGNLARSIKSKSAKIKNKRVVVGAIRYGVYVPHAHLVSKGTGPRTRKSDGRYTGIMPPNFYWDIAYEQNKGEFVKNMEDHIIDEVNKVIKRKLNKQLKVTNRK